MKLFLTLAMLLSFTTTYANSFDEKFLVIKDADGNVTEIKSKKLSAKFSIKPYLVQLKKDLLELQDYMSRHKADMDDEMDAIISDFESETKSTSGMDLKILKTSLNQMPAVDVNDLFERLTKKDVLVKFEEKMNEELAGLSLNMLANLKDGRYFYKRAVTYKAVMWALDYARKQFSEIPVLNTAIYVITQIEKNMRERRTYQQNMLLHYFQYAHDCQYGLTKKEMDLAKSSIYESRISWSDFLTSSQAANSWETWGYYQFVNQLRTGNGTVLMMQDLGVETLNRLDYAFVEIMEEGSKKIINLLDKKHMFSKKPSIAFNYDKPEQVYRTRQILGIAQIGLSFVPVPDGIKGLINDFINSTYEKQRLTEGALVAYFDSIDDVVMSQTIQKQKFNAYDF